MNVSDPVDVAEAAKAKAAAHDIGIDKKLPHAQETIEESNIEPAPITQKPVLSVVEDDSLDKVYPSDEDLQTLRRVAGALPWTTFTVAFVELCERFSYYGTTAVCTWQSSQHINSFISRLSY